MLILWQGNAEMQAGHAIAAKAPEKEWAHKKVILIHWPQSPRTIVKRQGDEVLKSDSDQSYLSQ
jgi:hypothetical protein